MTWSPCCRFSAELNWLKSGTTTSYFNTVRPSDGTEWRAKALLELNAIKTTLTD